MEYRVLTRLALIVLLSAPVIGQEETAPYFSLSSSRTYASNGEPKVALTAFNVASLEFRVYRINDAVKFLQQLDDASRFGGTAPAPPRERTLLEKIRSWKRSHKAGILRSLRGQFTDPPSQSLPGIFHAAPSAVPTEKTRRYAETPVLNSQQLVMTFQVPIAPGRAKWDTQQVNIPTKDKGVYLVEAVTGEHRAYTILMVSDIVLSTKTASNRIFNYVVDRQTGEPVDGTEVFILSKGNERTTVKTNAQGIVEVPVPEGPAREVRVVAKRGADVAANILSEYEFNSFHDRDLGYIFTDRPVYRPGHTVKFKAITRVRGVDGYTISAGKEYAVEIQGPDGKPVYQKKLKTTNMGTVFDEIVLPNNAALGYYYVELRFDRGSANGVFEVEDYKKPEYEVRVSSAPSRVLQGEKAQVTIDSRYYFGEPVSGATVKISVYRERYWNPAWYRADDDENSEQGDEEESAGDEVDQREGKLDADGKLTIAIPTQISEHKLSYRYRVEARVTDAGRREISGTGWLVATYGSFDVDIDSERYFYSPGARAAVTFAARDYDNKPVVTPVRIDVLKWNYRDPMQTQILATSTSVTDSAGKGRIEIAMPSVGGSYRLRVTARTPDGRDVQSYSSVWVSGSAGGDAVSQTNEALEMIPDKRSYAAGETAKVLIITGRANVPVLVSVEGRDLKESKIIRSKEQTIQFEVPVTRTSEPGFYVGAEFYYDGVAHRGSKYLKVPPVGHTLKVDLTSPKSQYQPGETATYNLAVTDAAGKAVPNAELSVGVVDEAIYAIKKDRTPDILNFFWGRAWNTVNSSDSLTYYFHGEAGKRRMQLAAIRPMSKLAQLKPERLAEAKVRKLFPDTAFWAPAIVTGPDGRASAKVTLPDSLTTWRTTARGVTADTSVGAATLKSIVRKNIIIRLSMPRFFIRGDEVVVSAMVHNYLTQAKDAKISLDVQGLDILNGATQTVSVPSRGEVRVDWRVKAKAVTTAKLKASALTNEESDALEMDIPVNFPGVLLSESKGSSLVAGASAALSLAFPDGVEPGSRKLTVRMSPTIAGALFNAVDYLTTFPYGCTEQTMSSFLPNVIVRQAVNTLGVKSDLNDAVLQQKIRDGLDRLYNYQHEDGGWGWWADDESQIFMSAYVVSGLTEAKAAGVSIRDEVLERGAEYLRKQLKAEPRLALDLKAYVEYALGGPSTIFNERSRLSPYGLAFLGLTLEKNKDARVGEISTMLEQSAKQNDTEAWWMSDSDALLGVGIDTSAEATAFVVKLLSHQKPKSPLLPKAAQWLMNHRRDGYWWYSTKQTAMVIYGLTDYLKLTNELNSKLNVTVTLNGKPVSANTGTAELVFDESKLQPGSNQIQITSSGTGRLYYSANADYFSSDAKQQRNGGIALNVLRDYYKLTPTRSGEKIVYDTTPLSGTLSPGDVIAVRLTVTGSDHRYLLVRDPIPAGTEFIAKDDQYELRTKPSWWSYYFSRREMHDDHMAIFMEHFSAGQTQFFYLLKVVNPGTFQVSPAQVQPMYQPGIMATTGAFRMEVR